MARLFNRIPLTCDVCSGKIETDIDDYGYGSSHICGDCHYELMDEDGNETSYGMGPHVHMVVDGLIVIGGTKLHDLGGYNQDSNGRYWIPKMESWFTPDAEVDGSMGVWEKK